mmetsp:Transcript_48030/g.141766  ORF Transcript_48030/g.141766 Transcript_48030/m.141766 type:complete len:185 (-) Transcript_48030:116-670(-)
MTAHPSTMTRTRLGAKARRAPAWVAALVAVALGACGLPAARSFVAALRPAAARCAVARRARGGGMDDDISPMVAVDTIANFKEVSSAGGVSIAMFSSPYCGPCMLIEPKVKEMAAEFEDAGVKVYKINLTPGGNGKELKPLFSELKIAELPTFLVYKDGEVQGKVTGTRSDELKELVSGLIAKA